jgi:SAM-dependent methyltransferase
MVRGELSARQHPRSIVQPNISMFQKTLDRLSENPQAWNILRRIVENGFRGEKEVIARELDPWRDPGQREFLDFGCGTGEFAACFPPEHYTGVDLAPYYVRFAGRNHAGSFAVASGAAIGLANARFDAALVLGVFHHMPDQLVRATVAELHRVMKPGATLLVMEDIPPPDAWNIAGRMMHWLDRGGFIRADAEYRALLEPQFAARRTYNIRSGICDYEVYVLERN